MKHLGCYLEFTDARNADLMRAYREQLRLCGFIVMPDIFARVADSPSVRFWVSEERAALVIAAMDAGRTLHRMRPNKREMFAEIHRRVIRLRTLHPHRTLYDLVTEVVNQPAPKFYLTARTVGEFIYRIKNGWHEHRHEKTSRYKTSNK